MAFQIEQIAFRKHFKLLNFFPESDFFWYSDSHGSVLENKGSLILFISLLLLPFPWRNVLKVIICCEFGEAWYFGGPCELKSDCSRFHYSPSPAMIAIIWNTFVRTLYLESLVNNGSLTVFLSLTLVPFSWQDRHNFWRISMKLIICRIFWWSLWVEVWLYFWKSQASQNQFFLMKEEFCQILKQSDKQTRINEIMFQQNWQLKIEKTSKDLFSQKHCR